MHPYIAEKLAEATIRDRLREAERHRRARLLTSATRLGRLRYRLRNLDVVRLRRRRRRSSPAAPPQPRAEQTTMAMAESTASGPDDLEVREEPRHDDACLADTR